MDNYSNERKGKKSRIILSVIIVAVIILAVAGITLSYDFENKNFDLGRIYKLFYESEKEVLYKGNHIVLYNYPEYDLAKDESSRQNMINRGLGYEALQYYAQENGITVTETEIKNQISKAKEAYDSVQDKKAKEDFAEILAGMDITEEEYWKSDMLYNSTRRILIFDKVMTNQRSQIQESNPNFTSSEIDAELEKWKNETIERVLEEDHVKKLE